MLLKRIIRLLVLLSQVISILSGPLQLWNYEFLEANTYSSDRSKFDVYGEIVRVARGQYGINAYADLKIDLYDDAIFSPTIERSLNRDGPYTKLPFAIGNYTLSMGMNMFYKTVFQPSAQCCENAPIINGTFKPPLTKRRVVGRNCILNTENLPNIVMDGYYRFRLTMYGPFVAYAETISYVEAKLL